MSNYLNIAERLHSDKATWCKDLNICVFHSNMVNAIRLERFRKYPHKFSRIESAQMNELKQRLIKSGDFNATQNIH